MKFYVSYGFCFFDWIYAGLFLYTGTGQYSGAQHYQHIWLETQLTPDFWYLSGVCHGADDLFCSTVSSEPDVYLSARDHTDHRRPLHCMACDPHLPQQTGGNHNPKRSHTFGGTTSSACECKNLVLHFLFAQCILHSKL